MSMCHSTTSPKATLRTDLLLTKKRSLLGMRRRSKRRIPSSISIDDCSERTAPLDVDDSVSFRTRGSHASPGIKSCLKVKTQGESISRPGLLHENSSLPSIPQHQQTEEPLVTFSTVELRPFPIALGDNPSVSSGPPLTIGWKHEGSCMLPVEEYEESRPIRRTREMMKLPRHLREEWLREEGYSRGEITEASKQAQRIFRSRQRNSHESPLKLDEGLQSLQRKFSRFLLKSPSDKTLYVHWKEQQHQQIHQVKAVSA